jgi:hypothetical protein
MRGVFEYAATGNLRDYLVTQRLLQADRDSDQRRQFLILRLDLALDIVSGMSHLAAANVSLSHFSSASSVWFIDNKCMQNNGQCCRLFTASWPPRTSSSMTTWCANSSVLTRHSGPRV